jgi:hypothetical protein
MREQIISVGLLTQRDLDVLGQGFTRHFPVDQSPCFQDLIKAIDDAELQRNQVATEQSSR